MFGCFYESFELFECRIVCHVNRCTITRWLAVLRCAMTVSGAWIIPTSAASLIHTSFARHSTSIIVSVGIVRTSVESLAATKIMQVEKHLIHANSHFSAMTFKRFLSSSNVFHSQNKIGKKALSSYALNLCL